MMELKEAKYNISQLVDPDEFGSVLLDINLFKTEGFYGRDGLLHGLRFREFGCVSPSTSAGGAITEIVVVNVPDYAICPECSSTFKTPEGTSFYDIFYGPSKLRQMVSLEKRIRDLGDLENMMERMMEYGYLMRLQASNFRSVPSFFPDFLNVYSEAVGASLTTLVNDWVKHYSGPGKEEAEKFFLHEFLHGDHPRLGSGLPFDPADPRTQQRAKELLAPDAWCVAQLLPPDQIGEPSLELLRFMYPPVVPGGLIYAPAFMLTVSGVLAGLSHSYRFVRCELTPGEFDTLSLLYEAPDESKPREIVGRLNHFIALVKAL